MGLAKPMALSVHAREKMLVEAVGDAAPEADASATGTNGETDGTAPQSR